jgi:hypothetical protein
MIALDISDLYKPYVEKKEYLALVRVGSTGDTKIKGYWLLDVLGADMKGGALLPLAVQGVLSRFLPLKETL